MKSILDTVKGLFGKGRRAPPEPKWVDGAQNQFGVTLLDLRHSVSGSTAWTLSEDVANTFSQQRKADGTAYVNKLPHDPVEFESNLTYPYPGAHEDGPLFKAEVMEDKWDIYVYAGRLYISRSWTGNLCFVALCDFLTEHVKIRKILAERKFIADDIQYAGRVVDYLIKSHQSDMVVPHPLPISMKRQAPAEIAAHSFEMFGRRGLFGSFEETIGIFGQPASAPNDR